MTSVYEFLSSFCELVFIYIVIESLVIKDMWEAYFNDKIPYLDELAEEYQKIIIDFQKNCIEKEIKDDMEGIRQLFDDFEKLYIILPLFWEALTK